MPIGRAPCLRRRPRTRHSRQHKDGRCRVPRHRRLCGGDRSVEPRRHPRPTRRQMGQVDHPGQSASRHGHSEQRPLYRPDDLEPAEVRQRSTNRQTAGAAQPSRGLDYPRGSDPVGSSGTWPKPGKKAARSPRPITRRGNDTNRASCSPDCSNAALRWRRIRPSAATAFSGCRFYGHAAAPARLRHQIIRQSHGLRK